MNCEIKDLKSFERAFDVYTVYPVWIDIYCPITSFLFRKNMAKEKHRDRGESVRGEPSFF